MIGGAISLPLATAFGTVGAALRLPSSTVAAVARKPTAPRERAAAYLAVANRDWFHPRGLDAALVDTAQLGALVGKDGDKLLETARAAAVKSGRSGSGSGGDGGGTDAVEAQLTALSAEYISPGLEVLPATAATLEIGAKTLWLVVVQKEADE